MFICKDEEAQWLSRVGRLSRMYVSTTTSDSNELLYPFGLSGHENALQPKRWKQLDPSGDYPPAPSDQSEIRKKTLCYQGYRENYFVLQSRQKDLSYWNRQIWYFESYLNYVFNFYIFVFLYRHIIKSCVNATGEDCVVFTGSGTTSAIHKLIHALELEQRRDEKNVRTKQINYF